MIGYELSTSLLMVLLLMMPWVCFIRLKVIYIGNKSRKPILSHIPAIFNYNLTLKSIFFLNPHGSIITYKIALKINKTWDW